MNKTKILRWSILSIILLGSMLISYLHISGGAAYPSVHAICPLGGLENMWAWVAGRGNLQKLFTGTMTLFFFTLAFALVFGRAFCGNICPFGFLQELFGKITRKKIHIPRSVDKYLRLTKYLVLVLITVMAWVTFTIWVSPYDPWTAFSHIWSGAEVFNENLIGVIILVVVLGASIFVDRFFCRYLCPAGAIYGLLAKISPTKIKRKSCISCSRCSNACPMDIDVKGQETIDAIECIDCSECVEACPSKNSDVNITFFGKVIKPVVFIIITVGVFFGGIFVLDAMDLMQVTVPSIENVEKTGDYIKLADLKGSMSIELGAKYTGMKLSAFYKIMEIPEEVPKETLLKEVQDFVPGYDFHAIKANK